MKFLRRAALLLLGLVLLLVAGFYLRVRLAWPRVAGEQQLSGLGQQVEVLRDQWGVPHLFAETEKDLFFAQGFIHAQDRFWQMHFSRLAASGELASLLGQPLLEADHFLRALGLRRAAERDWAALDPESRERLEAYAAGVNAYLETSWLPIENSLIGPKPQRWTPIDSLAWGKLLSLNISLNLGYELFRFDLAEKLGAAAPAALMLPYPADAPKVLGDWRPPQEGQQALADPMVLAGLKPNGASWGSNSWVVGKERSATGAPILANDTHLGLGLPSVWYENSLHAPGFEVTGFSSPGLPMVIIGHNGKIAWGVTALCGDVQDFFLETLDDAEKPKRYLHEGEWQDLEIREEILEVAGGEPETLVVRETLHGPLMNGAFPELKDKAPMALSWSALKREGHLLLALSKLNRAGNWQEFKAALELWDSPSLHITYADHQGSIGYQSTGLIPVRGGDADGLMPVDGSSGKADWQSYIPWQDMPRALDPPSGFVATANNKVVGDDYPYHIAFDMADPYRARRITQLLEANAKVTLDDVKAMQADVLTLQGEDFLPFFAEIEPQNEREREALALVRSWDLKLDRQSRGGVIFEAFFWQLWAELFEDDLGAPLLENYRRIGASQPGALLAILKEDGNPFLDDQRTEGQVETRKDILGRSFSKAVVYLSEKMGSKVQNWSWGRIHPMRFHHIPLGQAGIAPLDWIFSSNEEPAAGDIYTINLGMYDPAAPFEMNFGSAQRMIVDLGDFSRSLSVNSTGQVAHPFHPHRDDQIALWRKVDYHPLIFQRAEAEKYRESLLRLLP